MPPSASPVVVPESIGRKPLDAEEARWWAAWRTSRDERAKQELLSLHLPYARIVAALMYGQRIDDDIEFDEYHQLARVGLLESLERYDPAMGATFRTFASQRVRGVVLDGLARMTERQQQLAVRRRVLAERTASVAAMEGAKKLRGDRPQAGALQGAELFEYLAQVGVGLALGFMLDDTGMLAQGEESAAHLAQPYRAVELDQTRVQLASLVGQLPPAEQRIIRMHYQQGHPFDDIAAELHVTKGRVSQVHKRALGMLRNLLARRPDCDRAF